MKDSKLKSLLKGISWRFFGTLDTILISYFYSHSSFSAFKIGFAEIPTKITLYYVHERIYFHTFGAKAYSKKISLIKGITWRILGTMDTILLAWIFTGDPKMGLQIGVTELFTKIGLYYIHERIWKRI